MSNATFDISVTDNVVLVCIDDDDCRQRVTAVLREEWPVRTAIDAETAIDSLDEAVSVVLVDARDGIEQAIPRPQRDERPFELAALVDESVDGTDRAVECVTRPVSPETLRATVERLQRRVEYDQLLGRYYAVASEYAATASGHEREPETVSELKERLSTMRTRLDELADGLDDHDAFSVALGTPDETESPEE